MNKVSKTPKVSFLIPCFNEVRTIGKCIQSVIGQSLKPCEILVVDDGSTDHSKEIISSFKEVKLIRLPKNTGNKSRALEIALKKAKGDYIAFTDADTTVRYDFLEQTLKGFNDKQVGAVSGKVISNEKNLITGARQLDYIVGQELHKKGQSILGAIFVIPGCAAVYKKEAIEQIKFEHDTVTEDVDMTLKLHKLGYRIAYASKAIVYTNDPFDFVSYTKQLKRWYIGTFQNFKKHRDLIGKGFLGKVEIPLILIENFFFGFLYLFVPFLFILNPVITSALVTFDMLTVVIIALYSAIKMKRFSLIPAIPVNYFLKIWQNIIWFYAFITVLVFRQKNLTWYRAKR